MIHITYSDISWPKQVVWSNQTLRGSNDNPPLYPEGENKLSVNSGMSPQIHVLSALSSIDNILF